MKVGGVEATEQNTIDGVYNVQRPVMFIIKDVSCASERAFIDCIGFLFDNAAFAMPTLIRAICSRHESPVHSQG